MSRFWREFCKLLGANVSLSSGFHPQSNGQTERANQDLERMLRCVVSKNPSSWSQQLSIVEYANNTLPVSSTGLSPFECSVGYQPPIFPSLESEVAVPTPSSRGVTALGLEPVRLYSKWGHAPRPKPTATGLGLPYTSWVKKCGFLPRSFLSAPCPINLHPNSLARSMSPKSLVRWQSASTFLRRTGEFIPPFMYLK